MHVNDSTNTKGHGDPAPTGPQYLTSADAARILDVTPATVRLMVRKGKLRARAWTERGMLLFRRQDVERLARKRIRQGLTRPRLTEGP